MAQNPAFDEEATFQRPGHPEEPEERQIGIDPFSLRQFSRLNIDRPLPIPSVSVDDHRHLPAPARYASASVPCSAAAAPTRWDAHLAVAYPAASSACNNPSAMSRSKSCATAGETDADDDEFDVILSSPERRASAPQRWGSDVPLIAGASAKNGRRRKGRHGGSSEAPLGCCLYLPGLTGRRGKHPPTAVRAASVPETCSGAYAESDPGSARPSAMSLGVSLERFECRFSSRSSGFLDLDGGVGEASSSYFDLPLELILDGGDDDETDLPVNAAFMFDSDGIRKSVLKKGVGRAEARRPSIGKVSADDSGADRISARHVRFSLTAESATTPAAS